MTESEKRRDRKIDLPEEPFSQGLVQVYTGNGKGKTTAAIGLAVRAAGQGLHVYIVQFMKGVAYGELASLARLPNITIKQFGYPEWVDPKCVTEEDRQRAEEALNDATQALVSGKYQMVILDEVNVAVKWGLLPVDRLVRTISMRPSNVELVLTGRSASPEVVSLADLVTEMREVKHPYQKGISSRRGIEF